ncbi:MAG: GNAT family N-acetyltransferase [Atribacterota bacterium]|nr:GNAT family N-acetyltransferase [Atribacterota bacterium]MDD4764718.1 GNAT family N-acetyltransferase [Atribacterota bacterium]
MEYSINKIRFKDWSQIKKIYLEGINTGNATFETKAPSWEEWDANHIKSCRLAARKKDKVYGWAALSPVSRRSVYSGVAEISIYVGKDYQGKGVGNALLKKLIKTSEDNNFWTLQSTIFLENKDSIALHEKCGFRIIGIREKIGKMKDGTWRDVFLMERRSKLQF